MEMDGRISFEFFMWQAQPATVSARLLSATNPPTQPPTSDLAKNQRAMHVFVVAHMTPRYEWWTCA